MCDACGEALSEPDGAMAATEGYGIPGPRRVLVGPRRRDPARERAALRVVRVGHRDDRARPLGNRRRRGLSAAVTADPAPKAPALPRGAGARGARCTAPAATLATPGELAAIASSGRSSSPTSARRLPRIGVAGFMTSVMRTRGRRTQASARSGGTSGTPGRRAARRTRRRPRPDADCRDIDESTSGCGSVSSSGASRDRGGARATCADRGAPFALRSSSASVGGALLVGRFDERGGRRITARAPRSESPAASSRSRCTSSSMPSPFSASTIAMSASREVASACSARSHTASSVAARAAISIDAARVAT